jgi:hypothetical protein
MRQQLRPFRRNPYIQQQLRKEASDYEHPDQMEKLRSDPDRYAAPSMRFQSDIVEG